MNTENRSNSKAASRAEKPVVLQGIDTLLFDLDGTLLPMDEDKFVRLYLGSLAQTFADRYDPALLQKTLWEAVGLMVGNDRDCTNETRLWDLMESRFPGITELKGEFDRYYRSGFDAASPACPQREGTGEFLEQLKNAGYTLILATNPIFPAAAVQQRLKWAGVDPSLFADITTYENSTRCKPNPAYYQEILDRNALDPGKCMMIGNDTNEDMTAESLGMKTFLVTEHLIDRKQLGTERWPHGDFEALKKLFAPVLRKSED